MKLLMENWRRYLNEADDDFEVHMMFDPETGEKKEAKTEAEHNKYAADGYVHVDPDDIRKALEDEGGAAGMDAIVKRVDAEEEQVQKALDGMPDVAKHKKGDFIVGDEDKVKIEEDCWDGYERVEGTVEGAPGSCRKQKQKKKTNEAEEEVEEGKICDAGIQYVLRTDPGGKDIHRGDEDTDGDGEKEIKNWSARAAQIASKKCKDPSYGTGKSKKKNEAALSEEEGGLGNWEKENWTHSDGSPCGDPSDGGDGSTSRCKPASKWKEMDDDEKAADNAKKKKGNEAGKANVSATKKGKVTKSHTKESLDLNERGSQLESNFQNAIMDFIVEQMQTMGMNAGDPIDRNRIKKQVMSIVSTAISAIGLEEGVEVKDKYDDEVEKRNKKSMKQGLAFLKKENVESFVDIVLDEAMAELEEGGRCTKATQKTSSTSKNKKWMKCIKNPDGKGYIRKHWGQKGVRATGDSGDTDRKKNFRARHGCADAKPGTSKKLACDDW
tara:strand:+ start:2438 stop:3925 length:1488 start_codon:yes stop_codon:yes gene_type:complete